ncbi:hypothetical protein B7494_g122 [Chlorociboria aeruginascens]|nr:hypothetical protein B7494_g122 [Chlorociboria aeruginascens]
MLVTIIADLFLVGKVTIVPNQSNFEMSARQRAFVWGRLVQLLDRWECRLERDGLSAIPIAGDYDASAILAEESQVTSHLSPHFNPQRQRNTSHPTRNAGISIELTYEYGTAVRQSISGIGKLRFPGLTSLVCSSSSSSSSSSPSLLYLTLLSLLSPFIFSNSQDPLTPLGIVVSPAWCAHSLIHSSPQAVPISKDTPTLHRLFRSSKMAGGANPFAKRDSHPAQAVWTYKVLTILTWLLVLIATLYYTFNAPTDDKKHWRKTIWGQNDTYATPFALNSVIVSIYWIALFIFQIGYVWHLFSANTEYVNAAASVGSHFIFNNLLQFAFVMLFVRSHFVWAEIILIVNFFNLSSLYFRHSTHPRFIHIPVVSGPLAWTFVALYWNGAIAVGAHNLAARIIANIAIWGILVYGGFFLVAYKDYTMGFALSILAAALGVSQFFTKIFALQWMFAFAIMAILFISTLVIAVPGIFGKEVVVEKTGENTGIKTIDDLDIVIRLMEQLTREELSVKNEIGRTAAFLAGRFAAKEAAIKAYSTRQLTYHDIIIHSLPSKNGRSQAPVALIKPEKGKWKDSQIVPLSISHDGDYATAVCLSATNPANVYLRYRERTMETARRKVMQTKRKRYQPPPALRVNLAKESAVFVEGLSKEVDIAALTNAFKPFSEGVSAHICKDRFGNRRGYGFVVLGDAEKAASAIREMDNTVLETGVIRCVLAKDEVEERLNPHSVRDYWVDVGKSIDFEEKAYDPDLNLNYTKPEKKVVVKIDPAEKDELEFWRKTEATLTKEQEASLPKDDDEID